MTHYYTDAGRILRNKIDVEKPEQFIKVAHDLKCK